MNKKEKLFISSKEMPSSVVKEKVVGLGRISNVHIPFYIFVPVVIILAYCSFFVVNVSILTFALYFISAFVFWSCFEYFAHRYVLHYEPTSELGKKIMYSVHHGHHDYPNDKRFILVGPEITVPALFIFFGIFYLLLGWTNVFPYMTGMVSCYIFYDWLHYAAHAYNFKNTLFQKYKQHHLNHHYLDNEKNYGFITFIWDQLMNTRIDTKSSKTKVTVQGNNTKLNKSIN